MQRLELKEEEEEEVGVVGCCAVVGGRNKFKLKT